MKIVAIVYAISLLILLIMYLFNHKKSKGFIFKAKESWYITIIAALFVFIAAPAIVLLYPFFYIKSSKQKKEIEKRNLEWDKKQEEEQRQKELALARYDEVLNNRKNECDSDFIDLAQQLRSSIKNKDYHSIALILDRLILPSGTSLRVEECKREGIGDESRLYVKPSFGERDFKVFDTLCFERSCMGTWQAFLLHQIRYYLPLWWHANYIRRDYIYSSSDLDIIRDSLSLDGIRDLDLAPTIYRSGNHYYVSCAYWSEFGD